MVQRYTYDQVLGIIPDVEGGIVFYEDYVRLEAELRIAIAEQAAVSRELCEKIEELQKYKDQFPDYVECANCGSVTHVEGVE